MSTGRRRGRGSRARASPARRRLLRRRRRRHASVRAAAEARSPRGRARLLLPRGRGLAVACASRYVFGRPARPQRGINPAVDFEELFERERRGMTTESRASMPGSSCGSGTPRTGPAWRCSCSAAPTRLSGGSTARRRAGGRAGRRRPSDSWGRPVGAIKAAVIAGSELGGGLLALGARAGLRRGGVADRPVCGDARAARPPALAGGRGARSYAPGAGRLPGGRSPTRSR